MSENPGQKKSSRRALKQYVLGLGIGSVAALYGVVALAMGETFLPFDTVKVRRVPQLVGLGLERLNEMGVTVAGHGHGDAAREIEILVAVLGENPNALAPIKAERLTRVGGQYRFHHFMSLMRNAAWL